MQNNILFSSIEKTLYYRVINECKGSSENAILAAKILIDHFQESGYDEIIGQLKFNDKMEILYMLFVDWFGYGINSDDSTEGLRIICEEMPQRLLLIL